MEWFDVTVEHEATGITGIHYVQASSPSEAREKAGGPGLLVPPNGVRTSGPNTHYPRLPNYVGRPCN